MSSARKPALNLNISYCSDSEVGLSRQLFCRSLFRKSGLLISITCTLRCEKILFSSRCRWEFSYRYLAEKRYLLRIYLIVEEVSQSYTSHWWPWTGIFTSWKADTLLQLSYSQFHRRRAFHLDRRRQRMSGNESNPSVASYSFASWFPPFLSPLQSGN